MKITILSSALTLLAACSTSAVTPDAPVSTVPTSAAGTFGVRGVLDLQTLPAPADALVSELVDATDGPDDPAQFLCDRLVAKLPSTWQSVATTIADDVVAPALQAELDKIAPNFASGVRALAAGLGEVAHHMGTIETFAIQPSGETTRTITGMSYDDMVLDFASAGMADAVAATTVALDTDGNLAIAGNQVQIPYGRLLRLAFDRAVIPAVDFNAADLGGALTDLVDCGQLGQLFADKVGFGSPSIYAGACTAALSALAEDFYAKLAAIDASPFVLAETGAAVGIDLDGDGAMDEIQSGVWTGTSSYAGSAAPLVGATFTGTK